VHLDKLYSPITTPHLHIPRMRISWDLGLIGILQFHDVPDFPYSGYVNRRVRLPTSVSVRFARHVVWYIVFDPNVVSYIWLRVSDHLMYLSGHFHAFEPLIKAVKLWHSFSSFPAQFRWPIVPPRMSRDCSKPKCRYFVPCFVPPSISLSLSLSLFNLAI